MQYFDTHNGIPYAVTADFAGLERRALARFAESFAGVDCVVFSIDRVIFSVDAMGDTGADHYPLNAFEDYFYSQRPEGMLLRAQGVWQGNSEPAYICNPLDFFWIVRHCRFVQKQDCFMNVESGHRGVQYAWAVDFQRDAHLRDKRKFLGVLRSYSPAQFRELDPKPEGYTYREDMNKYFVAGL